MNSKQALDNVVFATPEEYDVIKKDLEVLEILKNKSVDIWFIKNLINQFSTDELNKDKKYILSKYNHLNIKDNKLSVEEFEKIIRWLEDENTK